MKAKDLAPGCDQHEKYRSAVTKKTLVQYDYRAYNGKLFSCVKPTLAACHAARDKWILKEDSQ